MSRFWHMLIFFCYVTLASAMAVLAHRVIPGVDAVTSLLMGLAFFLCCALLQESFTRRTDTLKAMRRLLLLKRALDRDREEMSIARNEIRRLFEAVEDGGGERMLAALNSLTASASAAQEATRHAQQPNRSREETEAKSLLERMALAEEDEVPPAGRPNRARPDPGRPDPGRPESGRLPRDRAADSDRSMREANSEVRVLHNLVEQLYSGRDKPSSSLSEESTSLQSRSAPREPTLGRAPTLGPQSRNNLGFEEDEEDRVAAGGGLARALRGGLRVVTNGGTTTDSQRNENAPAEDAMLSTIRDALKDDRVDLYLQPIVSLPQRKRRFYECFSRIRAANGEVIGPDRYIPVAKSAGLLTAIDNMLLFRCVQLLRKLRRKDFSAAFFCNIAPHTLKDREFFRDFIQYMESHSELAPNLVLEFSQSDIGPNFQGLGSDFNRLGGLGYRFSLDGVRNLDLDLDALEERHFAYIKIEAETVLSRLQKGGTPATELRALKQELDRRGIDLIVDRIETEATLVELLDFNIDFGQGYLFGEPRLSKEPAGA
ncbi:MAG: EAL domain-containing protein [Alphaproteobacteria bacterium]|nr:EAL domain-containing protein [Alphaproteobacteria bacterium]